MTSPNLPPQHPEQHLFQDQEIVQYQSGEMGLSFSKPGDRLLLNHFHHKYARDLFHSNAAIILTSSGNAYGIAYGIVLNANQRSASELTNDPIDIVIGEPCTIPGAGQTTSVEKVVLAYKLSPPNSPIADRQVQAPSPFDTLREQAIDATLTFSSR